MHVNGEIGTIEPIREAGKVVHEKVAFFHVDAFAAAGQVPINVEDEFIGVMFANLGFSYIEDESLIQSLGMLGVICSSGLACTPKTLELSHVLLAFGLKNEEAHGSLLFILGRKQNTDEDINYVVGVLSGIVKRLRTISSLTPKELRA